MRFYYFFILIIFYASFVQADIFKDLRALGGNNVLFKKAKLLAPEKKITIVQKRLVDRKLRHEFNFEMAYLLGGDAFLNTSRFGINYLFHITPHLSFGLKGTMAFNQISKEGEVFIDRAMNLYNEFKSLKPLVPDIDYEKYAAYLTFVWYPLYGKFNLYEIGIGHYDLYFLIGGGRLWLRRGTALGLTGGGGLAFWLANHFSLRLELRYETYKAKRLSITSGQRLHLTTLNVALGYIL